MNQSCTSEVIWVTLDPDFVNSRQNGPKKLIDLCIKKVISDVYILKSSYPALPRTIHKRLLYATVAQNRILSTRHLVQSYPYETLKLPVPDSLKCFDTITKRSSSERKSYQENLVATAMVMISTFIDIINDNSKNSRLQCLDLGDIPISSANFIRVSLSLAPKRISTSILPLKYVLKIVIAFDNTCNMEQICRFINHAKAMGLQIILTGIRCHNDHYDSSSVMKLFCMSNVVDLQQFGIYFAGVVPSLEPILLSLSNFKFVKYLDLSYVSMSSFQGRFCRVLATVLSQFICLERLFLTGIRLTGELSTILRGYCEYENRIPGKQCCLIHNGTLKFLNVAFCRLTFKDIAVLQLLKDCLKYLNISSNSLDPPSTFVTLFSLKSSLCALEMAHCFRRQVQYDPRVFPLKHFEKLRYLNVKSVFETQNCHKMIDEELSKLPHEVYVISS